MLQTTHSSGPERLTYRATAFVLLLAVASIAPASAQVDPGDGLPIGPWLIAPSFEADYSIDNNVRRAPDSDDDPVERIASSKFELEALLPFRNSTLELNYGIDLLEYAENKLDADAAQDLGIEVEFNFGSGDRLLLSDAFSEDFARFETLETVDAGGELTFIGEPYRVNSWNAQLERLIPNRPGYLLQVHRTDFNYKGQAEVDFFDYRGLESAAEYRHPLPGNRWLVARYDNRRFDHFDRDDPVGVSFRQEKSDTLNVGLLGELGKRQPFTLRLGYGRYRYPQANGETSEYSGVVGIGTWVLKLGDLTEMTVELVRQTLPSNFEAYYVYSSARVAVDREIVRSIEGRLEMRLNRNLYGRAVFDGCGGEVRDDRRVQLGGELEWEVHPRFGFELYADFEQRGSNCDFAEYDTTSIGMSIKTGWF